VLPHFDGVRDGEWYRSADRNGEESPGENEEQRVYEENGGWDNIVQAQIPMYMCSTIGNLKNRFKGTHRRLPVSISWSSGCSEPRL